MHPLCIWTYNVTVSPASAGFSTGGMTARKVIPGEYPASVRRVSRESPRLPQPVWLMGLRIVALGYGSLAIRADIRRLVSPMACTTYDPEVQPPSATALLPAAVSPREYAGSAATRVP